MHADEESPPPIEAAEQVPTKRRRNYRYDPDELRRLKFEEGLTFDQIVERLGGTRSGVAAAMKREGLTKPLPRYVETIPWRVSVEHTKTHVAEMLRLGARHLRGEKLEGSDATQYFSFAAKLRAAGVVVDYDPDHPPNPASEKGGFHFVPRAGEDGDSLIRTPPKSAP